MKHFYRNLTGHFNFESFYTEMVNRLPVNAKCVEIGVWHGQSLAYLIVESINVGKQFEFNAIDPWCVDLYDSTLRKDKGDHYKQFIDNMRSNNVLDKINVVRLTSAEAAPTFEDDSLDFIFIDGLHDYKNVCQDIDLWLPKVKKGGVIAGHDYMEKAPEDVKKAVDERFPNKRLIKNVWVYNVV